MKYFLIINPRSGNEQCRKRFGRILNEFGKNGLDHDHVFASSCETIRAESEYANQHGYDVVVAVGGDGTINAAINGFYDGFGHRVSAARFGVVYTGISPDFCNSYGIPLDEERAVAALAGLRIRRIRLMRISFMKMADHGSARTRVYACCANIGLGAGVATFSNKIRKYTGDFAGTLTAILWTLARQGSLGLKVTVDGVTSELPRVLNISAGRTKYIASGIRVPDGVPDEDDRFYLLTAKNISLKVLPGLLFQAYTGKPASPGILEFKHARHAEFQSLVGPVGVEFDGDAAGFLPCTIELAPDPLDLIVSLPGIRTGPG